MIDVDEPGSSRRFVAVVAAVAVAVVGLPVAGLIAFDALSEPVTREARWQLIDVREDGRQLLIDVEHWPGCEPFHDVAVHKLTVAATIRHRFDLELCPELPQDQRIRIDLQAPLADKKLDGCGDGRDGDPLVADKPPPNGFCVEIP